ETPMSSAAPPIETVADTPIITVMAVAHTRRGARSSVVAPSVPGPPKIRAIAPAARTIGPVAAKQIRTDARKASEMAASDSRPRSAYATTTAPAASAAPAPAATHRRTGEDVSVLPAPTGTS